MPQSPRSLPHLQGRPQIARPPITTVAYQGPTPWFNPVSIGPTFTQPHPVNPPQDAPSTFYYVDPNVRQYPRLFPSQQAYVPPQPTYPYSNPPQMPYQKPPPIHQTVLSDEALRALMQAIGRGVPASTTFLIIRENHGSRNGSIAISKLMTKFQGEGDPITYVE